KGVTHFCVPNFTADLGRSASVAVGQAMLPYLLTIARHGVESAIQKCPELADVEVLHMKTVGIADYSLPQYEGHFRHNALFIGGNVRKAVQEGRADYTPIFLSEIEELFTSKAIEIDVCLLQCTPPDPYGYMSLGPSIDVSLTAAQCARHVIVEINEQCPRTL